MKQKTNPVSEVKKQRELRYFSEAVRKAIVEEMDNGLSKAEASRRYSVSMTTLYKWLSKYSTKYVKSLVKVVEHESESVRSKGLEEELKSVYALLGKSQAEVMFLKGLIEKANEAYGVDIKKNFAT